MGARLDAPDVDVSTVVLTQIQAAIARALDALRVGFLYSDGLRILVANATVSELTGYSLEELQAMPDAFMLIPPAERDAHRARMLARLTGGGAPARAEVAFVAKDGRRVEVELGIQLVPSAGAPGLIVTVAERPQAQTETLRRALFAALTCSDAHSAGGALANTLAGPDIRQSLRAFNALGLGELELISADERGRHDFTCTHRAGAPPTGARACEVTLEFLRRSLSRSSGRPAVGAEVECQRRGAAKCRLVVRTV